MEGTKQVEQLNRMLRSAGLRRTPFRAEVLGYLIEMGRPLSHTEIYAHLPDADRVTLYRTLASFVESDIAHQVQGLDGLWRFCAHTRDGEHCPGNHPHFLCTTCGRMTCLTEQSMPRVAVPGGCRVSGKQLVAYGACPDCSKNKDEV